MLDTNSFSIAKGGLQVQPHIAPVEKRRFLVREQALASIRAAIISGHYPPGTRLVDRDLCAMLGISRPTVREAIRRLEAEKLVIVEPHRGPIVAGVTIEEATDIYELRALLEAKTVEGFIRRAGPDQVDALKTATAEFEHAAKKHDLLALIGTMERYYGLLLSGAGNKVIQEIVELMMARISFLRARSMSDSSRLPHSVDEMKAITAAIERRDIKDARGACIEHVKSAASAALARLRDEVLTK